MIIDIGPKFLFDTIPTPAYDLAVKVTSKILRSLIFKILALIFFIFGMIMGIDPNVY